MVFVIDWRKYLCRTPKIMCRHASNQQTRNTTYRNIQYCYLLWSRKKVQSIEITLKWNDSFITLVSWHASFYISDKIIWQWHIWTSECQLAPIESAKFLSWSETATGAYWSVPIPINRKINVVRFPWSFSLPIFGCAPLPVWAANWIKLPVHLKYLFAGVI